MTDYVRFTYHARRDGAEPGRVLDHSSGNVTPPIDYEAQPIAELLVAREHLNSRQLRIALETLAGVDSGILQSMEKQRAPIDVERFPHRAFDLLTDEGKRRVCDLIRSLAAGTA